MSSVVENAAAYVAAQRDSAAQLPGYGLAELDAGRAAALEQLSRQGLPSQQDEDWKYTSTRSITRAAFKPASAGATCPSDFIAQSVLKGSTLTVWFLLMGFYPQRSLTLKHCQLMCVSEVWHRCYQRMLHLFCLNWDKCWASHRMDLQR